MEYLVHHLFERSYRLYPNKVAVSDGARRLTYGGLAGRAGSIASELLRAGVRRGDRIVLSLDHTVGYAAAILAVSAVGGVFVPVSLLLVPDQIRHIIRDSGATVLLTTAERRDRLGDIAAECHECGVVLLAEDIAGKRPFAPVSPCIENDLAALLYTSGSTGPPKGVMLSHRNLVAGVRIVSEYLNLTAEDHLLGVLQLSFDYGLNQLLTMLAAGGTYRFLSCTVPNQIVEVLAAEEITGFAGIPTIWTSLVRSTLAETLLPRLRYVTNSGGHVNPGLMAFLRNALPVHTDIVLMYGLTEAFRSTWLPPDELDSRPDSMGRAIPDTELFVVRGDGTLCGPGEVGELVHRGPTVALGYWRRPEDTAKRFRPLRIEGCLGAPDERVVYSGDLVRRDREGYFTFVGRGDGMIKSAGVRISPTEIESVLFQSGIVAETAVIGTPDPVLGQSIRAFVVPAPEYVHCSGDLVARLTEYCAMHLPRYMIPRRFEIVESLPRNASGKINYPVLNATV